MEIESISKISKIQTQTQTPLLKSKEDIMNIVNKQERPSFSANSAEISAELLKRAEVKSQVRGYTQEFLKRYPFLKLLYKLSDKKYSGDSTNIFITGFGTALVAPLMISCNPLSKEDKETKKYAAWRQPISALIAIISQGGINMQLRKTIEKRAEKGKLGESMNLRKANQNMARILDLKIDDMEIGGAPSKNRQAGKSFNEVSEEIKKLQDEAEAITKEVHHFRDLTGIGIALITLPIACGLLNWVYPRFMKLAFPEMSHEKDKKAKENNAKESIDYNIPYAGKLTTKAEG